MGTQRNKNIGRQMDTLQIETQSESESDRKIERTSDRGIERYTDKKIERNTLNEALNFRRKILNIF